MSEQEPQVRSFKFLGRTITTDQPPREHGVLPEVREPVLMDYAKRLDLFSDRVWQFRRGERYVDEHGVIRVVSPKQ